ncbi:MAG: NADH:flavin oxidoreductase/NADH oxidase [Bacteroidota bacterium]|jgi:2,4-dienoyl-CoA reductase-like NADH-dependent reductase (Old Yellow Enzyme family)
MSQLFKPIKIKSVDFKNRLVVSPMCQYSGTEGFANDWHLVHLGSRASGGAGLVIAEATSVSPEGRISIDDIGIWKDEHIPFLKRINDFIISQGSVPGVQLAHAGRKASNVAPWKGERLLSQAEGGWVCVAPSAIRFSNEAALPSALSIEGIEKVVYDFTAAAKRSVEAGFKVIEIHAAHGYLMHQFLSPLSNTRPDEYGGSFENRTRLLIRVTEGIRKSIPEDYPLFVRISCTDWADGGWNVAESVALVRILKGMGVDLMDCSSGGLVPGVKIPLGPGYQVGFSETVRKETGILTGAVGMITTAAQAESILEKGQADLILMARELLRDPYFPLHAAFELGDDIAWPKQYLRAKIKAK